MSETTDQTENQDLVIEEDEKVANEKFVADGGGYCPHCGSTNIYQETEGEKEFDPEEDWMVCNTCRGQWLEIYERRLVNIDLSEQDYFWTRLYLLNRDKAKKRVPKKL